MMEQLNKGYHYRQDMFHVAVNDEMGEDWDIMFSTGCSNEDDNDYSIATNHLHCDEIPEEVIDAKGTAELVVKLLNYYLKGYLFVGDPDQVELFKTK